MEICGKREMELLKKIGFTRIAGSPEEEKAAQILKAECDAIGVPAKMCIRDRPLPPGASIA